METLLAIGLIPILITLFIILVVIWAILRTADNTAKIRKLLELEIKKRDINNILTNIPSKSNMQEEIIVEPTSDEWKCRCGNINSNSALNCRKCGRSPKAII